MGFQVVTPNPGLPVSVDEAKSHARIDIVDDDPLIESYIRAAAEYAETVLRRFLLPTVVRQTFGRFPIGPGPLELPRPPLVVPDTGPAVVVTYVDHSGSEQTLDPEMYRVKHDDQNIRLWPAIGGHWPCVLGGPEHVAAQYTAGYANAAAIPANIKQALLILVSHYYEHREPVIIGGSVAVVPHSVDQLLWQRRVASLAGGCA